MIRYYFYNWLVFVNLKFKLFDCKLFRCNNGGFVIGDVIFEIILGIGCVYLNICYYLLFCRLKG